MILALMAGIYAAAPSLAAPSCDGRIMTTLENIPQAIAFFGYDEQCKAYKFVTPHHNCGLS
jgi:hypothetical protein